MNFIKNILASWGSAMSSRDSHSALRPMTYFSQTIGIFPLSLKGPIGRRKLTTSYSTLIYSSIALVSLMTSLVLLTPQFYRKNVKLQNISILEATMQIGLYSQLLSTVVIFVSVIIAKGKLADTINSLCAQDEALEKLGIRFDYATEFKRSCFRLGIILSIISILYTFNFVYKFDFNLRHPLIWTLWMSTHLIRMIDACLFAEITLFLTKKFTLLNENLTKIIRESEDYSFEMRSVRFKIRERIRSIAMIHRNLCKSGSKLNKIFSVNMIIGIVFAFIFLTSSSYYIVREIANPDRSYFKIIAFFNWGLISFIDMIYMVLVCDMAQNEAIQTGKLVHKLNVHRADVPLVNAIQNFSLQLHHGKLAFSAVGLFPLNITLVQSVVGAVTTYLVILIQFNEEK